MRSKWKCGAVSSEPSEQHFPESVSVFAVERSSQRVIACMPTHTPWHHRQARQAGSAKTVDQELSEHDRVPSSRLPPPCKTGNALWGTVLRQCLAGGPACPSGVESERPVSITGALTPELLVTGVRAPLANSQFGRCSKGVADQLLAAMREPTSNDNGRAGVCAQHPGTTLRYPEVHASASATSELACAIIVASSPHLTILSSAPATNVTVSLTCPIASDVFVSVIRSDADTPSITLPTAQLVFHNLSDTTPANLQVAGIPQGISRDPRSVTLGFVVSWHDGNMTSSQPNVISISVEDPPQIVQVEPTGGDNRQPVPVVVTGRQFQNTTGLQCRFGTIVQQRPSCTFVSSTEIHAIAPVRRDGFTGAAPVQLTNDGTNWFGEVTYTYTDARAQMIANAWRKFDIALACSLIGAVIILVGMEIVDRRFAVYLRDRALARQRDLDAKNAADKSRMGPDYLLSLIVNEDLGQ